MKNEDLVTIIVPVYNREKYIKETLQSILNQTYTNYEVIFVDDASTDASTSILEEYTKNNAKFKLIKLRKNMGVSFARNIGIRKASGRYVAFLDSDDLWLPHRLEEQIKFAKGNNYAFTYSAFKYITDDGSKISKKIEVPFELDYDTALLNTRILTITALIDLQKIPKYLCYMPRFKHEDMATWWKILKNGYTAYGLNKTLAYCRITEKSRSGNKIKSAYFRWKLYRKIEKLNIFKSIYCFIHYVFNAVKKRGGKYSVRKDNTLSVALSTMHLKNDEDVNNIINKMKITSDYLIVNQTDKGNINISNKNVVTRFERGLSKSRNTALDNCKSDVILFTDDDVTYVDNYSEIVLDAYLEHPKADMICFYVESTNNKRRTKRIRTGKLGYISAMKIISAEMSIKKESFERAKIRFDEDFGIGAPNNRGEEQILIYEALRKGLNVMFVNKKIADIDQTESTWLKDYDENYFYIQGKVYKRLTKKWCLFWILQYVIRKYPMYKKSVSFRLALKNMLKGAKEYK